MTGMFTLNEKLAVTQGELDAEQIDITLCNLEETEHLCAMATSDNGEKYFIQYWQPHHEALSVRAIHRVVNPEEPYGYSFYGRSGTNLEQVVLNGLLGEPTWATNEQIRRFWRAHTDQHYNEMSDSEFEIYLCKMRGANNPNPNNIH